MYVYTTVYFFTFFTGEGSDPFSFTAILFYFLVNVVQLNKVLSVIFTLAKNKKNLYRSEVLVMVKSVWRRRISS